MTNILEMLEATALRCPDKQAFGDPDKDITFGQLLTSAKKIGTYFLKNEYMNPAKEGNGVLFYMEKSTDALCAMFGGVYCNAFYCFLDIRQPADRARHIISLVNPSVIVTDEKNAENLKAILSGEGQEDKEATDGASSNVALTNAKVLMLSDLLADSNAVDADEKLPAYGTLPDADEALLADARSYFYDKLPLYVNFTSGSTGMPKGVVVGHASVIDFIRVFTKTFGITDEDIMANQAPFDFDVSVKDIYSGLYTGAKVQLIPRDYFSNPTILMDYLCDHKVTTLVWAVTAMCFVSIMNGFGYKIPETVNKVMFSGELMPIKQLNKWKKYLPDAKYVNLYGPTEITCNCTYHVLDREYENTEILPIGRAFENEKVFLLNEDDKLVTSDEPGVEGEICVSGSCLALGYFKDKEKTDKAFVQNPLNSNYLETIYRTGDLGKYDEQGLLYYTSRKDFQIKHMGQRIELGDIEVSAMSVEGVSRACCIYNHKAGRIIMFYTGDIEKEELSEQLRAKLPQFMIPGKTTKLEEFPVNKNGKIDRKALEEMK